MLDTTPTLRGGVNQCVDTYPNFSNFSKELVIIGSYVAYTTFINLQCIIIVNEPSRQSTPNVNGKLNHYSLIKTIHTISCRDAEDFNLLRSFSTPTEIRVPTLCTRPNLCSLRSNQEGFEESNPHSVQDLAYKKYA